MGVPYLSIAFFCLPFRHQLEDEYAEPVEPVHSGNIRPEWTGQHDREKPNRTQFAGNDLKTRHFNLIIHCTGDRREFCLFLDSSASSRFRRAPLWWLFFFHKSRPFWRHLLAALEKLNLGPITCRVMNPLILEKKDKTVSLWRRITCSTFYDLLNIEIC